MIHSSDPHLVFSNAINHLSLLTDQKKTKKKTKQTNGQITTSHNVHLMLK